MAQSWTDWTILVLREKARHVCAHKASGKAVSQKELRCPLSRVATALVDSCTHERLQEGSWKSNYFAVRAVRRNA